MPPSSPPGPEQADDRGIPRQSAEPLRSGSASVSSEGRQTHNKHMSVKALKQAHLKRQEHFS